MTKTKFINQQLRILATVLRPNKTQRELLKETLSYVYEQGGRDSQPETIWSSSDQIK